MRKQLTFSLTCLMTTILVVAAFLASLAVVFGLASKVAVPSEAESNSAQQSSDSVTHFMYPPSFDSGWVGIRDKLGQTFTLTHDLNTTEVFVDVTGRRKPTSADHKLFFGSTIYIPGWSKTYSGETSEEGAFVVRTSDGGYAIASTTWTVETDSTDFWLVTTNSTGGVVLNKTYGGADFEVATSIVQTADGGYAIAGINQSAVTGDYSFCLVKTFANGTMEWSKTYTPYAGQAAYSVVQTTDGGYAIAGVAVVPYKSSDILLVITNSSGDMQWNKNYGGTGPDYGYSVVQTTDGGYALAGLTAPTLLDKPDFWLVKTNSSGDMQWSEAYGGTDFEVAYSLIQTDDGGYALAGYTKSLGAGEEDFWLVKTNSTGGELWNATYGRTYSEKAWSVIQADDGGYALAGCTEYPEYDYDIWLVKTDLHGNMQWNKTCGGTDGYILSCSVVQASDGAYVIAGKKYGVDFFNLTLIKTDVADGSSIGLSMIDLTDSTITFYRGATDSYWNYIRVRIWEIKEPTWQYGDIDMDGDVDDGDLFILARNYWKTLPLDLAQMQTTNIPMATTTALATIVSTLGIHRLRKKTKQ